MTSRILFIFVLTGLFIIHAAKAQNIALVPFASGFDRPVDISHAGDSYLYITEQDGYIYKVDQNGTTLPNVFLDIEARVNSGGNERGLLGLVFHPNYASNGYFYVNYTATGGGATKISRFSVDPNNPDIAMPNSEYNLLTISQPYSNHNAGDLEFGPDGYLYIPLGDGGSGGDPQNISQNTTRLLGKMLRIDVDNGAPYSIPADNPFVNDPTVLDEIWAIGLRNPWRISFDKMTGDLYIADVGQDDFEEIDFQPASSAGGENYGWRCYEGNSPFNTNGCGAAGTYTFPIHEYPNNFSTGCSVTGGYVYRGTQWPGLYGQYIYADFCTGNFWTLENIAGSWVNTPVGTFSTQEYSSFGEDINGELYVSGLSDGNIYQIADAACQGLTLNSGAINDSNCDTDNSGSIILNIVSGVSYTIQWSNGATTDSIFNLAPGTYTATITDVNGCVLLVNLNPVGFINTAVVPSISYLAPQSLESSPASTYQWYVDGVLLPGETNQTVLYNQNGDYTVETTDANGCPATSLPYGVLVNNDDPQWLTYFSAVPSPFTDLLELEWTTGLSKQLNLEVINSLGQIVLTTSVNPNGTELMKTDHLVSGVYFIRLGTENVSTVKKVVKH